MSLAITALYGGLTALLLLGLSLRVSLLRIRHKVSLGDGEVKPLRWAMRAHGNAAEHGPVLILLLALIEAGGAPGVVAHLFGAAGLAARALASYGLATGGRAGFTPRSVGATITLLLYLLGGLGLVGHALVGGGL